MPAPRAAPSAAARKSLVPDPDLYGSASDDDDRARAPPRPAPAAPRAKQQQHSTLTRRGSRGPQPVRGSVTADNGRRRSSRLSAESAEHLADDQSRAAEPAQPRKGAAARAGSSTSKARDPADAADAAERASASRSAKVATAAKGKKRAAPARDDDDRADDAPASDGDDGRTSARGARSGPKRPRTGAVAGQDDVGAAPTTASQGAAPPARRGFVPRAVADLATRVNKPPPQYSTVLVDPEADDADPFPFTTNPPTPHAKGQAKRAASASKPNPHGAKAPRIAHHESSVPHASTSSSRQTPPHASTSSTHAPLHPHETPVQVKNIAFRAGAGPGTPGTAGRGAGAAGGKSVRRSSARGSAGRGSSIGGGFEAVPHPQVADDKLYRSTDAADPLAKRLRSLVSWAAQRTRDRVRQLAEPESPAERAARDVVDAFVDDVCRLRVDTSVPFSEPSRSQDPDALPPHPQNESNARRMQELEESYAAIASEQTLRQSLDPIYQAFFDRRAAAHESLASSSSSSTLGPLLPAPASARANPSAYAATLDLGLVESAPTTLDDVRALGRRLVSGEGVVVPDAAAAAAKARRKSSKGKGKAGAGMEEEAGLGEGGERQRELQRRIAEAQIDTAALHHLTHRLSSFARVARSYIAHRSADTHAALAAHSSAPAAPAAGEGADEGAGAGLAHALRGAAAGAEREAQGLDPRELLRAIAGADATR
ncbi:uncharacterized protein JCM10292_003670 [Rhodotorula paludigena]|uniref:uncharacterized protein n=1 Tax=Rhodotorula paludigena TaxID=86838 RepID=UPI00317AE558